MFDFFRLKKKPVIEDVEAKVTTTVAKSDPIWVDEALALQASAEALELQAQPQPEPVTESVTQPEPAPGPEAVPGPAPAPEVLGQLDTMMSTREDVIAAYKIFLGRMPESKEVVDARLGMSLPALMLEFLASTEFLNQPQKTQLVLVLAKKILDARNQAAAN